MVIALHLQASPERNVGEIDLDPEVQVQGSVLRVNSLCVYLSENKTSLSTSKICSENETGEGEWIGRERMSEQFMKRQSNTQLLY